MSVSVLDIYTIYIIHYIHIYKYIIYVMYGHLPPIAKTIQINGQDMQDTAKEGRTNS